MWLCSGHVAKWPFWILCESPDWWTPINVPVPSEESNLTPKCFCILTCFVGVQRPSEYNTYSSWHISWPSDSIIFQQIDFSWMQKTMILLQCFMFHGMWRMPAFMFVFVAHRVLGYVLEPFSGSGGQENKQMSIRKFLYYMEVGPCIHSTVLVIY